MSDQPQHYLQRRMPYALIITLLVQAASVLIWATQLDARVNGMEQQCAGASGLMEKFARLEERIDGVKQDIGNVKHQLDRLTDRLLK